MHRCERGSLLVGCGMFVLGFLEVGSLWGPLGMGLVLRNLTGGLLSGAPYVHSIKRNAPTLSLYKVKVLKVHYFSVFYAPKCAVALDCGAIQDSPLQRRNRRSSVRHMKVVCDDEIAGLPLMTIHSSYP
jgi:hypothetical protein